MPQQPNSRNIPSIIKRQVRQRCGFGCVICGLPLYEYEHMAEWALVRRHKAEEITLLCDKHHREKTSGLLPKPIVVEANENPHNLRNGTSEPYLLHYTGADAVVDIAGNIILKASGMNRSNLPMYLNAIIIDDTPLVQFVFDGDELLLNILLFDRYNRPVLEIVENQLIYNTEPWDIELVGTTLTLREKKGVIFIEFKFSPPNKISILRGKLMYSGVVLDIGKNGILIPGVNMRLRGNQSLNNSNGLVIGGRHKGSIAITHVDRYQSS